MDLIACGDFMSISCGTWVSLWSGAIGAFVAAVIGGLVALGVVWVTVRQGARQAEQARLITAIADMSAAAESALHDYYPDEGNPQVPHLIALRASLIRIGMCRGDTQELMRVLHNWPHLLIQLYMRRGRQLRAKDTEGADATFDQQNFATSVLTHLLPQWPLASKKYKGTIIEVLGNTEAELQMHVKGN